MNFSSKLIKLRKSNGLSQDDLANELNVSRQTISKWELGVTTPDMEKLKQISNYFGISVDELISETNNNDTKYVNNKEFIGVDEKYIPKQSADEFNKNYVNKNKKSNKIFLIYLIPILLVLIVFIFTAIMMISHSKDSKESQSTSFNQFKEEQENLLKETREKQEDLLKETREKQEDWLKKTE